MSEYKLIKELLQKSNSSKWDIAKLEWKLEDVYKILHSETCLCGHYPIIEICELRNSLNNELVIVGNCCVKKFTDLPSDKIFQSINRITKDKTKSFNAESIEHAFYKGWINDWERNFYLDIWRKKNLTQKQKEKKIQINQKIFTKLIKRRKIFQRIKNL